MNVRMDSVPTSNSTAYEITLNYGGQTVASIDAQGSAVITATFDGVTLRPPSGPRRYRQVTQGDFGVSPGNVAAFRVSGTDMELQYGHPNTLNHRVDYHPVPTPEVERAEEPA